MQVTGPYLQSFSLNRARWGLRICILNKFPGDASTAVWGSHFEDPPPPAGKLAGFPGGFKCGFHECLFFLPFMQGESVTRGLV